MFLPVLNYSYFMKKTLSIIAAGLLLAGCSNTIEASPAPTSTSPMTVDLLHWSKVTDFRTVLSKSGVQCTDSKFGTNEEKGWDYLRCETNTDSITAIMHDDPESYISSQYEENINADIFTFVYGENWVASCMGDLPEPCWDVLAGVTGSTLTNDKKAWISMGNNEVREIPKPA